MKVVKVKNADNKIQVFADKMRKMWFGFCAFVCGIMSFAVPTGAVSINTGATTETTVGGIISFILEVAKYMGFVVAATGVFMFVFAYKDDNAEAQSRAARFVVVGAILLGLGPILALTGLITL